MRLRLGEKALTYDGKEANTLRGCWPEWFWQDYDNSPVAQQRVDGGQLVYQSGQYRTGDVRRLENGGHEVPISKVISRYYKSLLNATKAISFADRAYIYDNSIDNQLPRLLYRTTDGQLFKQYVEDILEWAGMLLK